MNWAGQSPLNPMNSMPEVIQFQQPLRAACLVGPALSLELETLCQEREQTAYQRGRRDVERSLSEQMLQQRNDLKALKDGVLASLRESLPGVIREWEEGLVALTAELAEKVVAGMPISRELVQAVVREALEEVQHQSALTVLLHPDDLELLQTENSPLLTEEIGGEALTFRGSPEVTRGGCLVQTRFGKIDATREAKFDALKRSVGVPCN